MTINDMKEKIHQVRYVNRFREMMYEALVKSEKEKMEMLKKMLDSKQ